MKFIQTYWLRSPRLIPRKVEAAYYSLSCLTAKRFHGAIELYTDSNGAKFLLDELQLPYDKIHVVLDNFAAHPDLPAFAKFRVISLQTEPFVHIDSDLILNQAIPSDWLDESLICNFGATRPDLLKIAIFERYMDWLPRYYYHCECVGAFSTSIIGGGDWSALREFGESVIQMATGVDNRYAWPRLFKAMNGDVRQFSPIINESLLPAYARYVGLDCSVLPADMSTHLGLNKTSSTSFKSVMKELETRYPVEARRIHALS